MIKISTSSTIKHIDIIMKIHNNMSHTMLFLLVFNLKQMKVVTSKANRLRMCKIVLFYPLNQILYIAVDLVDLLILKNIHIGNFYLSS